MPELASIISPIRPYHHLMEPVNRRNKGTGFLIAKFFKRKFGTNF